MSKLPVGWSLDTLERIVSTDGVISDGDWIESKDQDFEGNIRLVQLADIGDGYFKNKSQRFMNSEQAQRLNCSLLQEDDVLIARMPDPLGRACLFPKKDKECVTIVDICFVRVSNNCGITPSLLMSWINSPEIRNRIAMQATGTTRKRITRKKLQVLELPLPPLNEQIHISNKLDSLLGKLEATQKHLDKIPTLLKRFRQSVLSAAMSGNLTLQWREEHNLTTADMLKGFTPLKKPARYKSRNLGYIQGVLATSVGKPKHSLVKNWEWVPLVDIAAMGTGHTPSRSKSEYWNGDKCWIGIKDARNNHSGTIFDTYQKTNDLGLANSAARILPKNTVCISRTASIGYVVKMGVPMSTSQDFVTWTPTEVLSSDWLKWLFVSEKESLFRFGRGSTHTTVYFPEWLSMHVALPPIEEQEEIVSRVESLFALLDTVEKQYLAATQQTNKLTQSILAKAFRGELVPQDPNHEPANKLLKRINESRA